MKLKTYIVLTVLICTASCAKKPIPDQKLINSFYAERETFEKYVEIFHSNPELYGIQVDHGFPGHIYFNQLKVKFDGSIASTSEVSVEIDNDTLVGEFKNKLGVYLVHTVTRTDQVNGKNNVVFFYMSTGGGPKGMAFVLDASKFQIVDDLSLYGTKKSPRIKNKGLPEQVLRKVEGNWYLMVN